jgi:hypothetical protein
MTTYQSPAARGTGNVRTSCVLAITYARDQALHLWLTPEDSLLPYDQAPNLNLINSKDHVTLNPAGTVDFNSRKAYLEKSRQLSGWSRSS